MSRYLWEQLGDRLIRTQVGGPCTGRGQRSEATVCKAPALRLPFGFPSALAFFLFTYTLRGVWGFERLMSCQGECCRDLRVCCPLREEG